MPCKWVRVPVTKQLLRTEHKYLLLVSRNHRLRGFLDLISSPLYQIQIGNGMPMTIARPANKEFPGPIPRAWYIWVPNNGKTKPKKLGRGGEGGISENFEAWRESWKHDALSKHGCSG